MLSSQVMHSDTRLLQHRPFIICSCCYESFPLITIQSMINFYFCLVRRLQCCLEISAIVAPLYSGLTDTKLDIDCKHWSHTGHSGSVVEIICFIICKKIVDEWKRKPDFVWYWFVFWFYFLVLYEELAKMETLYFKTNGNCSAEMCYWSIIHSHVSFTNRDSAN